MIVRVNKDTWKAYIKSQDFQLLALQVNRKGHSLIFESAPRNEDFPSGVVGELLKNNFKNQIQRSQTRFDCEVSKSGSQEDAKQIFTLEEFLAYVEKPARIVVENSLNDGRFITAVLRHFGVKGQFDKLRQLDKQQIAFCNSGGKNNIINYLDSLMEEFQNKSKFIKRTIVVMDGDDRYKDENEANNISNRNNVIEKCKKLGIVCFVLKKRSMENYMPDEVFDENRNVFGNDWVDAYLRLSDCQKDYYYIAEGFVKDVQPRRTAEDRETRLNLNSDVATYYHDVSDENYHKLLYAPTIQNGVSFKDAFPKFFIESPFVHKKSLQKRCKSTDENELQELANKVQEIL